jgi:uncharacterized protein
MESAELKTGLCVLAKRFDTNESWVITNNPKDIFWGDGAGRKSRDGQAWIGNRHMPLANIVRASAAAPHYFRPEYIEIEPGRPRGLFVDGAVTPHNNPSLQLLLVASLPQHGFQWPLGKDVLSIVSVGTGSFRRVFSIEEAKTMGNLKLALTSLTEMIKSNEDLVLQLMQVLGAQREQGHINSEIAPLESASVVSPMLSFARFDLALTQAEVARLGHAADARNVERLWALDEPSNMKTLYELAQKKAAEVVRLEDFAR